MTRGTKVALLANLLHQIENHGVVSHGETDSGYQWTCEEHIVALSLVNHLLELITVLQLDVSTFRHHFEGVDGAKLIIEPVGD